MRRWSSRCVIESNQPKKPIPPGLKPIQPGERSFTAPGPVSCTREISARSQRGGRVELRPGMVLSEPFHVTQLTTLLCSGYVWLCPQRSPCHSAYHLRPRQKKMPKTSWAFTRLRSSSMKQAQQKSRSNAVVICRRCNTDFRRKDLQRKGRDQEYWQAAGTFQPQNQWVAYTPAFRIKYEVEGDNAHLYFECLYVDKVKKNIAAHTNSDDSLVRVRGKWLIKDMNASSVPEP